MRLAAGLKVSALLRQVEAAGGFATVLARGDATAGSIAVVQRSRDGEDLLLTPVITAAGTYAYQETARGEAIPGWTSRARQRDPDLWIIELDIPDAARFIADTLTGD
jgi:hypothetical protein